MIETSARRSTAFAVFAAVQFAVLTGVAMQLYPDYRFTGNFLSDLGATRTWYGVPNHASAVVFAIAVVTLGASMIVLAAAWRDYAFERRRARGLGVASQICGTLSGLAFIGVGCAPLDVALDAHNGFVVAAFGLLLIFSATATILWARNGAPRAVIVAGLLYALMLAGYFAACGWAITHGQLENIHIMIVGQKITVYASLAYVIFIALTIRRRSTSA